MNLYDRMRSIGVPEERLRTLGITPEQPSPTELAARAAVILEQTKLAKERAQQRATNIAEYHRLRERNPFEAARFADSHPDMFNDDEPPTAA